MTIFRRNNLVSFVVGCIVGIALTTIVPLFLYLHIIPSWLVINNLPAKADAIVVLGGGDAARLRKGLELYDAHYADEVILVDRSKSDWNYIVRTMCPECSLEGKRVTYVTGSVSTENDALLTLPVALQRGFKAILVVTDPYHSRRADIVFRRVFLKKGIVITTLHSGDFRKWEPPNGRWRDHRTTRDVIWLETGKIVALMVPGFIREMINL